MMTEEELIWWGSLLSLLSVTVNVLWLNSYKFGKISKIVLDVLNDIDGEPETWNKFEMYDLCKGFITIIGSDQYYSIELVIDGEQFPLSTKDKWELYKILKKWMVSASVQNMRTQLKEVGK